MFPGHTNADNCWGKRETLRVWQAMPNIPAVSLQHLHIVCLLTPVIFKVSSVALTCERGTSFSHAWHPTLRLCPGTDPPFRHLSV